MIIKLIILFSFWLKISYRATIAACKLVHFMWNKQGVKIVQNKNQ